MVDASIEDLIPDILDRDEAAFGALYDATFTRLYSLAYKITRDASLAEEVVEDTFFQIWQELYRYDLNKCPLINWMLIICRSRAIDALRKMQTVPENVVIDDWRFESSEQASDEQLQMKQQAQMVMQALSQLNPMQRQLLYLVFYLGLSQQEIAQRMQMPLGTVKSTILRAHKVLKQQLKGEPF